MQRHGTARVLGCRRNLVRDRKFGRLQPPLSGTRLHEEGEGAGGQQGALERIVRLFVEKEFLDVMDLDPMVGGLRRSPQEEQR